jgi:hypothetical protein
LVLESEKVEKEAKVPWKRGRWGGRGSEGRARNDADTTLHLFPFASFIRGHVWTLFKLPTKKGKIWTFCFLFLSDFTTIPFKKEKEWS